MDVPVLKLALSRPLVSASVQAVTPGQGCSTVPPPVLIVRAHDVVLPLFHHRIGRSVLVKGLEVERLVASELKRSEDELTRLGEVSRELKLFGCLELVWASNNEGSETEREDDRVEKAHVESWERCWQ